MRSLLLAVCLSLNFFVATADAAPSNITILNRSSWDIYQLYLSSVNDSEWGPDQLSEDVIASGESFLLRGVPCDNYDVMLIDEDGDRCEVRNVDICGGRHQWVINDRDLLSCQGY